MHTARSETMLRQIARSDRRRGPPPDPHEGPSPLHRALESPLSPRTHGARSGAGLRSQREPQIARLAERPLSPAKERPAPSTQNSLPSGSARTIHDCSPCPTSARVAPTPRSRSTSASRSSGRKSRCNRFLIVFCSETTANRSPGRRSAAGRISNSSGSWLTTIQPSALPLATNSRARSGPGRRRSFAPTRGSRLDRRT